MSELNMMGIKCPSGELRNKVMMLSDAEIIRLILNCELYPKGNADLIKRLKELLKEKI